MCFASVSSAGKPGGIRAPVWVRVSCKEVQLLVLVASFGVCSSGVESDPELWRVIRGDFEEKGSFLDVEASSLAHSGPILPGSLEIA